MKQWFRVLISGLLCAMIFDISLPYIWLFIKDLTSGFTETYQRYVFWTFIATSLYASSETIRIGRHQPNGWIRYPPIWFSVVFGFFLAGSREQWFPNCSIQDSTVFTDDINSIPIGWCAAILALSVVFIRWIQSANTSANSTNPNIVSGEEITPSSVQVWMASGERPRESDEADLFAHRYLVERIVSKLKSQGQSVGLLGPIGSGKSSILNAVQAELDRIAPRMIVAKIDVWTVSKPEDVPSVALNQIINALDQLVDTVELRGLGRSYKRLAAAEPSGWISRLVHVDHSRDSLEVLQRLQPMLTLFDARIVLVVEDVERAGEGFDNRHLMRFLWALRQLDGCGFVFAVDSSIGIDMTKLCDTIERVPKVSVEEVTRIFLSAYQYWTSVYSDIEPHPNREGVDKFKFRTTNPDVLYYELRAHGWDCAQSDLVALLQTPRALKHVICRVSQAWDKLHGEAELDDIVIISVLRYGAPEAYAFLLAHIDIARQQPGTWQPDIDALDKIKDKWKKLVKSIPNGQSVQALVDLLEIETLKSVGPVALTLSPQGVHIREPVDYFSRIVAEELAPRELRDQEVLRDIHGWEIDRTDSLIRRLVPSETGDDHYLRVWSNLAVEPREQDLIDLARAVLKRALSIYRASIDLRLPALVTLLEKCRDHLLGPQHLELIIWMTRISISHSLSFVNGLVAYWEGDSVGAIRP